MSLLGIDLGTSGTTALLIDDSGQMLSCASAPYSKSFPRANYEEQSPEQVWDAVCSAIRQALQQTSCLAKIQGISIASQRGTFIPVDKKFRPLSNAILWSDLRAKHEAEELSQELGGDIYTQITGCLPSSLWAASKIRWFVNSYHKPEAIFAFWNLHEWIAQKLGSELILTSPSLLTMNGMMDIRSLNWSETVLKHIGISAEQLPKIEKSSFPTGLVSSLASQLTGLPAGTPIFLGGGDQQCAALGTASTNENDIHISLGTGGAILSCQKVLPLPKAGSIIGGHILEHSWVYEALLLSAGNGYTWLQRTIGSAEFNDIDILLEHEKSTTDLLFFPFLSGQVEKGTGDRSTGVFWGIHSGITSKNFAQSVLEGTANEIKLKLSTLSDNGDPVHVSGACFYSKVWSQMIAAKIQRSLLLPACLESTALGAAMIAGVGSACFRDYAEAVTRCVSFERSIDPDPDLIPSMNLGYERFIRLYEKFQALSLF